MTTSVYNSIVDQNGITFQLCPKADLQAIRLTGTALRDLDLTGADLRGATLHAVSFENVTLSEVDASGVYASKCILRRCRALEASFRGARLPNLSISNSNFARADFSDTLLRGANISATGLANVNFINASLFAAVILNSHMEHSLWSQADLSEASLLNVVLRGADFSQTKLNRCFWNPADRTPVPHGYRMIAAPMDPLSHLELDPVALRDFAKTLGVDEELASMLCEEHSDISLNQVHELLRNFAKVTLARAS
jgi:hypothetical protein